MGHSEMYGFTVTVWCEPFLQGVYSIRRHTECCEPFLQRDVLH